MALKERKTRGKQTEVFLLVIKQLEVGREKNLAGDGGRTGRMC